MWLFQKLVQPLPGEIGSDFEEVNWIDPLKLFQRKTGICSRFPENFRFCLNVFNLLLTTKTIFILYKIEFSTSKAIYAIHMYNTSSSSSSSLNVEWNNVGNSWKSKVNFQYVHLLDPFPLVVIVIKLPSFLQSVYERFLSWVKPLKLKYERRKIASLCQKVGIDVWKIDYYRGKEINLFKQLAWWKCIVLLRMQLQLHTCTHSAKSI